MAARQASTTITVPMTLTKETKGTYVFGADDEEAVVTTLYVRKSAFPKGAPESVTVTIV